jgi:galactose mutarotase-like enzyme
LFFSLGTHPGFSCNVANANGLENFFLEFEKEENTARNFVKDGLIDDATEKFLTDNKKFPLGKNTFEKDAVVLKKINSQSVKLLNNKNPHGLELKWGKEFSYFGIWSKPGCEKFVCLEPWAGIADGINFTGNLNEKEGILQLKPSEEKEFELEMRFF